MGLWLSRALLLRPLAPGAVNDASAEAVVAAAQQAGRLLFAAFPVDFPVTAAVVDSYAEAK